MSTNLQSARRERAAMKPQPVESVAGTTMQTVAGAMIVLGAIAFVLALLRGGAAIAWEAYLVNLLFFLGVAQGALVASAAFYLTQAKWGGSTPYRLGEAFAPFLWVGFFLFFGLYFGRSLIFPVGDASDRAEGRMAEHSVSLCTRWNRARRDGCGELRVHSRLARRRCTSVDDRDRRHRVAAAFDTSARARWSRSCSPSSTR